MTTGGKVIIVTMYYWFGNINRCNTYNNNATKRGTGVELYEWNISVYHLN